MIYLKLGIMCGSKSSSSMEAYERNSEMIRAIADTGYTFVMGAGETGTMRNVKEILRENGNMLITVGNSLELGRTIADIKVEVRSTFERAERIYENSDVIIFLDGGTGTLSEFYSFLNNKVETDDKKKELVVVNIDGVYNKVIDDLKRRYKEGLTDNVLKCFAEVKSPEGLKAYLGEVEKKFNGSEQER